MITTVGRGLLTDSREEARRHLRRRTRVSPRQADAPLYETDSEALSCAVGRALSVVSAPCVRTPAAGEAAAARWAAREAAAAAERAALADRPPLPSHFRVVTRHISVLRYCRTHGRALLFVATDDRSGKWLDLPVASLTSEEVYSAVTMTPAVEIGPRVLAGNGRADTGTFSRKRSLGVVAISLPLGAKAWKKDLHESATGWTVSPGAYFVF